MMPVTEFENEAAARSTAERTACVDESLPHSPRFPRLSCDAERLLDVMSVTELEDGAV
jgi:hypothetical protein